VAYETLHQMPDPQAPQRVSQIRPDSRRARHSMPILPTGSGQDYTGAKHTFDASQLGTRDDGNTTLNRKGLLVKKTDAELLADIRRSGNAIDDHWDGAFLLSGNVDLGGLQKVESHANALAIYCKLLRQRLEAQDPAIQHLRATLQEGE